MVYWWLMSIWMLVKMGRISVGEKVGKVDVD